MINGKRIVLTGASSGIGLEVLKLLKEGPDNRILAVSRHAVEKLTGFAPNVVPFDCDVSSPEGIEKLFDKAESMFEKIDIFYANAGYPYYERYDYLDWERVEKMFRTNTFAPMYTFSRYLKHLNGRDGHLAITVSAIGQMAVPGYAVYSASKFATQGFQQAVRVEKPKNLKMTCLYPVATDTNFFVVAADGEKFEKPFPVQKPEVVARKMVSGIEHNKKYVSPCFLFGVSKVLMGIFPFVREIYWKMEYQKLVRFEKKMAKKEK